MRVAIMQPTYLPWIGYFDMMDQVDLFVLLDNVQFVKRSWQQRNRIKTPKGLEWLTVPVAVSDRYTQSISEAAIAEPEFWRKHLRSIEMNYRKASCFHFSESLHDLLASGAPWVRLVELNVKLIDWMAERLTIQTPRVRSSSLGVDGKRSGLLAGLCAAVGATDYLSPIGSATYLLEEMPEFTRRGIEVRFHHYSFPTYQQMFPPFVPYASALDAILNEGLQARPIMISGRGQPFLSEDVKRESEMKE